MYIAGPETRVCPPEFQERLTRLFGKNQFGDPNFRVVWGQSQFMKMGNVWRDKFGGEQMGYRYAYQTDGTPCWNILKWYPASHYGSPAGYYMHTYMPRNPVEGIYATGEYPWRGRYEIMQPLRSKEFVNGELKLEHFPLSHYMIDSIIPMILAWQRLSYEEQTAACQLAEQERIKRENQENADRMMDNMPVWVHPVSYSRQGCRTSILDKKMHQIQRVWDRMAREGLKPIFSKNLKIGGKTECQYQ